MKHEAIAAQKWAWACKIGAPFLPLPLLTVSRPRSTYAVLANIVECAIMQANTLFVLNVAFDMQRVDFRINIIEVAS